MRDVTLLDALRVIVIPLLAALLAYHLVGLMYGRTATPRAEVDRAQTQAIAAVAVFLLVLIWMT